MISLSLLLLETVNSVPTKEACEVKERQGAGEARGHLLPTWSQPAPQAAHRPRLGSGRTPILKARQLSYHLIKLFSSDGPFR